MKTLVTIIALIGITSVCFAQGQFSQTTTADFNTNVNFNINTSNDEMKLTNDVGNGLMGTYTFPLLERLSLIPSRRT